MVAIKNEDKILVEIRRTIGQPFSADYVSSFIFKPVPFWAKVVTIRGPNITRYVIHKRFLKAVVATARLHGFAVNRFGFYRNIDCDGSFHREPLEILLKVIKHEKTESNDGET